ncbi:YIP1 family protein [Desulfovibrio sp. TomC]|uniref:YIP1 family protein n=1 Tax=Desulfovibrio sp. TomC TaxID=1562888 RepID=UPI001E57CBB3|nr:YIP1 family protein [Desulfovibrio sp. TomC]
MMRITCPQCGFFRELPDTKAPVTPTMATCPKCRHRFRFRPDPISATPGSRLPAGEEGVSSWRRSAAKQDRQPPAAAWESLDESTQEIVPEDGVATTEAPELDVVTDATFAPAPPSDYSGQASLVSHDGLPEPMPPERRGQDVEPEDLSAPGDDPDEPVSLSHWAKPVESDRPATHQRLVDPAPARSRTRATRPPAAPVEPETPPAPVSRPADPAPQAATRDGTDEPATRLPVEPVEAVEPVALVEPPQVERPVPPPAPEIAPPPAAAVEPVVATPAVQPPSAKEISAADATAEASEDSPPAAKKPEPALRSDGVRDIWARLQAMDDRKPGKPRVEHQRPAEDEPEEPQREAVTDPIPWERQDAYGFFPGLFLTLRQILLHPMDFFDSLPIGRPKGKALVFNLLISEFLLVIDFMWSLFGLRARIGSPGGPEAMSSLGHSPSLTFLGAMLLVPLVLSVGIYLDAWVTHLLLLLFRSTKKGFNETFRVLCYSAAPTVLSAVPVAGQLLSPVILIWYMALQAIGLKKCHEAAYTQTLAAIFIKWSIYLFLLLAMLQSFTPGQ